MARKKQHEDNLNLPALGDEGDACAECGAGLATDQRYCLNCGTRRGAARLDYEPMLFGNAAAAAGPAMAAAGPGASGRIPAVREWNPITAVGAIAVLGVMLLLGVLIGRDDNNTTTQSAATPAAATTTATPTATTAAAPTKTPKKAGAGPNAAVAGGSGSTEGIASATTIGKTGQDLVDASKNSPDVVATEGDPEQLDPNGKPGGGSSATCIGGC
jgi:hypothetical protein